MKIVVATDSFKGSMRSDEAGAIIADALRESLSDAEIKVIPVADGGEGTTDAVVRATGGELRAAEVTGPLGEKVTAHYGLLPDGETAVMEMASASGIELVPREQLDPMKATTYGTGELMRAAIETALYGLPAARTQEGRDLRQQYRPWSGGASRVALEFHDGIHQYRVEYELLDAAGEPVERMTVRREYETLYGIGLVLAAYTAATAAGGDGFLAAFAAGLGVVLFNQTLSDCFLEYGQVTAEMAMLLAFVLFGAVLSGILDEVDVLPALVVAGILIFVVRPGVLGIVLARAKMSLEARAFVSWFGPRGLNSLLLALLAVHAGIDDAELLLATIGLVVLTSTVIHGATATTVSAWYARRAERETLVEERESTAAGLFEHDETAVPRVSVDELNHMLGQPDPPVVLDVRTHLSYNRDRAQIPQSVRVPPDHVAEWDPEDVQDRLIVAYCT